MNGYLQLLTGLALALASVAPGIARPVGAEPAADDPQVIRRTLAWPAGTSDRTFELSNITGAVTIVGEDRADVSVVATRTVTRQGAPGDAGPTPDFRSTAGTLLVCGDSRRCGCHIDSVNPERWDDERTRVRTDFEVHVPRAAVLDVCTVNGGKLQVQGTEGRFTIASVNGDIDVSNVSGSGRMSTVNGSVTASFSAAPHDSTRFQTVNGKIVVRLPATISADLRLQTVNGGIYTDFETAPLPASSSVERRNGRRVYRMDRFRTVRIGSGGPELTFQTVNGEIQVRKN